MIPHSGMADRRRGRGPCGLLDRAESYEEKPEPQASRRQLRRTSHLPEQVSERLADRQRFFAVFEFYGQVSSEVA